MHKCKESSVSLKLKELSTGEADRKASYGDASTQSVTDSSQISSPNKKSKKVDPDK